MLVPKTIAVDINVWQHWLDPIYTGHKIVSEYVYA